MTLSEWLTRPTVSIQSITALCGYKLKSFASLVAAFEREKIARWMMANEYATGDGDSTEDLLAELKWQIEEQIND